MGPTDCNRRDLLKLGGAGAVVAVAGCLDSLGGSSSSAPSYRDDLVADEDGNVVAFYTTWGENELFSGSDEGGDSTDDGFGAGNGGDSSAGEGDLQDPLLFPVASPLLISVFGAFTLGFTPLSPVLGLEDGSGAMGNSSESNAPEVQTEISEVLMTANGDGFAFSMSGDIDTDELDELLTGESELLGFVPIQYTESGEINGYTQYDIEGGTGGEGRNGTGFEVDIDEDASSIAIGSDRIIFGAPEAIDRLTADGSANPAGESETLDWLLGASGDGDFGVTVYAPEGLDGDTLDEIGGGGTDDDGSAGDGDNTTDPDVGEQAEAIFEQLDVTPLGISGTMTEESEEEAAVEMGVVLDSEIQGEVRETIESEFGADADDRSLDFQGDRVAVSGSYSDIEGSQ
jgi:hypothetical protein